MPGKDDLIQAYKEAFGCAPPARASEAFLQGNVDYHRQTKLHGGLKPNTIRDLVTLAEGKPTLKEGTKFIRNWQGNTYEVAVTSEGRFIFRNQPYRSLSAIAREITGTPWNGRAFFGVTKALQHG